MKAAWGPTGRWHLRNTLKGLEILEGAVYNIWHLVRRLSDTVQNESYRIMMVSLERCNDDDEDDDKVDTPIIPLSVTAADPL